MSNTSNRWRWSRVVRYFAWFAAATVVLLISLVLFLAAIVDTPPVEAEIRRQLSAFVRGEVAWDDMSIRILPVPHGILRKVRVEIPGVASISAEQADARLRVWPLLRGRAEIASVTLVRPDVRVSLKPAPPAKEKPPEETAAPDALELYRSVMGSVVQALREFAPNTDFAIENAEADVRAPGMPPIQLSRLTLRARTGMQGLELEATAASPYWDRLRLTARVAFADLSARASLDATDIKLQAWLDRYLVTSPVGISVTAASLRAEARTDARTTLECEIDAHTDSVGIARAGERAHVRDVGVKGSVKVGAKETIIALDDVRLGASRLTAGELRFSAKDGALSGHSGYDLDLAQGMEYTRRLVPARAREALAPLVRISGRAQGRVTFAIGPPGWSVGVDVRNSDVAVQVRDLPGPVRLGSGAVLIDSHGVRLDRVALSMPAGTVLLATLQHHYRDGSTTGNANIDLDVAQSLELARRALPPGNREALADIETATGRVEGRTTFALSRGGWKGEVDVSKSDATLGVRQLPGPVGIKGLSVEANPASVTIGRAALSLLDANVVASATFDEYGSGPRIRGAIAEGSIGEKLLAWVWETAKLPLRYEPSAPIRFAVPRLTWRRGGSLDLQASAQFDAGPSAGVDLSWKAGELEIRRATIKDGRSDAGISLRARGNVLDGRYGGSLSSTSIAAVLKRVRMPAGAVAGDLRFTIDREHPGNMSASGHLKGESLHLESLTGQPLVIERIDLATDEDALLVHEAAVNWAGQRATLRGELKRSASGPVINAQLESPGVDLDALLPHGTGTPAVGQTKPAAGETEAVSRLWPLPVTGKIAVRADSVQRGRHRVAPLAATLLLEERRAHLDLEQATICGVSLPLVLEATPQGYSASARISAQKQELQQSAHCLSGERVVITGEYDLQADISTQGTLAELPRNLKGTVRADARDGKVMKFALLGNILSMASVSALMTPGGAKLDDQGFPYRMLLVAGRLEAGRFIVEEGAFHSDAVGLAASGWISTTDLSSRLTVLVAPFSRLDELVRKVPLVGYIVGGAFTSVPVGVSGDIRDPLVVPLGPVAVGSEVLGIFERTLKLPVKLVAPLEGSRGPAAPPDGP